MTVSADNTETLTPLRCPTLVEPRWILFDAWKNFPLAAHEPLIEKLDAKMAMDPSGDSCIIAIPINGKGSDVVVDQITDVLNPLGFSLSGIFYQNHEKGRSAISAFRRISGEKIH